MHAYICAHARACPHHTCTITMCLMCETDRRRESTSNIVSHAFPPLNKTLQNFLPLPGKTVPPGPLPGFVLRACGSHCTCPAVQPPCEQSAAASYCQCQGCPLLTDKVTGVRSNQRFFSLQEFWGVQGISTILWLYDYYFCSFNVYISVKLVKCGVLTHVSEMWHYRNDRCYYFEFYESHLFWLL